MLRTSGCALTAACTTRCSRMNSSSVGMGIGLRRPRASAAPARAVTAMRVVLTPRRVA